jgi:hypothetical protein
MDQVQAEDARTARRYRVAVADVQEWTGVTWVDDMGLDEALRLAAYWRQVPGFRAYTYPEA